MAVTGSDNRFHLKAQLLHLTLLFNRSVWCTALHLPQQGWVGGGRGEGGGSAIIAEMGIDRVGCFNTVIV